MILKNVECSWIFVTRPDQFGNFKVTFKATPELHNQLEQLALATLKKVDIEVDSEGLEKLKSKFQTYFSYNPDEDTYTAKRKSSYVDKKGNTQEVDNVPVFDKFARELEIKDVPMMSSATLNISVGAYYYTHNKSKGISLSLNAIQIVDYEAYEGRDSFDSIAEPVDVDEAKLQKASIQSKSSTVDVSQPWSDGADTVKF